MELLLVTIILAPHHLDGEWRCGQRDQCGTIGLTLQVIGGLVSFFRRMVLQSQEISLNKAMI